MLFRFNPNGNWIGTQLSEDDLGAGGTAEEGQPEVGSEPEAQAEGQPFHSWTAPDGRTHSWNDPKELSQFLTSSAFMQSDYSRKTDELKAQREAFEKEREEINSLNQRLENFRKGLEAHPELFQEFEQRFRSPATQEEVLKQSHGYVDSKLEELMKRLDALDEFVQDSKFERSKSEVYGKLKEEFGDEFDQDAVEELLSSMGTSHEAVARLAFDAIRGRKGALKAQELARTEVENERRVSATVGSGRRQASGGSGGGSSKPMSVSEAVDQWHDQHGE